jgi:parallel beta-helix repeat protein
MGFRITRAIGITFLFTAVLAALFTAVLSAAAPSKMVIKISPSSAAVEVGKTVQLSATDASGKVVAANWSSSATSIATVNGNGLVTGVAAGQSSITARIGSSRATATVSVTAAAVTAPTCTYTITPTSTSASSAGGSVSVNVTASATTCTWTTSNNGLSWLTTSGGRTGSGAATVTIAANTLSTARTGVATIATRSFTVTQAGVPPPSDPALVDPSWVIVNPGEAIQSLVNLYPSGTTFYLTAGTHRRQTITPKTDDRFIGEAGAVMDGENVTPYAFLAPTTLPQRVTIKGLDIRNYASGSSQGAIHGDNGISWVVEDNVVHNNLMIGIRVGRGWQVRRNKVYRNGVIGISGYRADGALIEANEVYENVTTVDAGLTAQTSGMKFLRCINLVIRSNNVHHNFAKGIWLDGNYPTTVIEGNTASYNAHAGIWAEATYGVIIRNNVAERNGPQTTPGSLLGYAGIQVSNSANIEIYGNTVRDNSNGIGLMQSNATPTTDPVYGVLELRNVYVHDNVVRMQIGRTGIVQIVSNTSYFTSKNNRFVHNTYYLSANPAYYAWMDTNLNEWQWAGYGLDVTGTFIR